MFWWAWRNEIMKGFEDRKKDTREHPQYWKNVDCPKCGAALGENCRQPSDSKFTGHANPHAERWKKARSPKASKADSVSNAVPAFEGGRASKMNANDKLKKAIVENPEGALAWGFLRYETVRKLNARQYSEICARNLKGENFDSMIDELITKDGQ